MKDDALIRRADHALDTAHELRLERKLLVESGDESRGKLAELIQEARTSRERSRSAGESVSFVLADPS
jgi:hypothetical protein